MKLTRKNIFRFVVQNVVLLLLNLSAQGEINGVFESVNNACKLGSFPTVWQFSFNSCPPIGLRYIRDG